MQSDRPITPHRVEQFCRALLDTLDFNDASAAVGLSPADLMLAMEEGSAGHPIFQRYTNAMYNRIELDMLCRALSGTRTRSKEETVAGGHVVHDDAQALRLLTAHRARQEKRAAEVAKLAGTASAHEPESAPPPTSADALFAFIRDRVKAAEGVGTDPRDQDSPEAAMARRRGPG